MGPETMGSSFGGAGKSHPALPAFSFNPGASLSPDKSSFLSPPESLMAPTGLGNNNPPSPRSSSVTRSQHGHRRGGSEFVGGSIRGGDSITVLGIPQTKSEGGFDMPPDVKPLSGPPPGGRRGHAHRRSAAISSHDISKIIVPPKPIDHGHSAPNSPTNFEKKDDMMSLNNIIPPITIDSSPAPAQEPSSLAVPSDSCLNSSSSRSRVGFSETIEVIPRPLSVISTDTSSTLTVKQSNSTSERTSPAPATTSLPTVQDTTPIVTISPAPATTMSPPMRPKLESRPSTAGAILDHVTTQDRPEFDSSASKRRNSIPTLLNLPEPSEEEKAALRNIKSPKRWSFFGLDAHKVRPLSSSSHESGRKRSSEKAAEPAVDAPVATEGPKDGKKRRKSKKGKKKAKGKTWGVPILSRKSKHQVRKCRSGSLRSPTPTQQLMIGSLEDCIAPESNEVMDPEFAVPSTPIIPTIEFPDATPKQKRLDEDSSIAMIDLDAALGPFNTPLAPNPEWDAAQRAAGNVKRKLHSAQGMKGFSGPGMHYHRRTESAPEMVPFERSGFGVHRFGSNSTMADVFEEDEEDEEAIDSDSSSARSADITPTRRSPIHHASSVVSTSTVADENVPATPSGPRASGMLAFPAEVTPSHTMKTEPSSASIKTDLSSEDIIYASRTPAFVNDSPCPSGTPSPRRVLVGKELAPVNVSPFHLPPANQSPASSYAISQGSSFPSPMSPVSYDTQCLSTAPSSLNDETTFQSLLCGEPGPEVRISVDIPSLTSTTSAGTRESVAQYPNRPVTQSRDERPVSMSSAFGRRRSSLASLSRLINSSHGERSKLSMEIPLEGFEERKSKPSRTKRISRLVQFWKPKESSA
ncbi:hypothetical protein TD95_002665 [Thielaviopsis punctulata]|uniref:Cell wall proline rich protein n=1 Tax=Thielaviopsis punctulata TaxID=72032 RepID=A0A0F4ZKK4_9PEZI|nr:hypothetical protein TD95_002665 [Thielaviopsis punctulata]